MHWFLHDVAVISSACRDTIDTPNPHPHPHPPHPTPSLRRMCRSDSARDWLLATNKPNTLKPGRRNSSPSDSSPGQSLRVLKQMRSCFVTLSPVVKCHSKGLTVVQVDITPTKSDTETIVQVSVLILSDVGMKI